MGDRERIVLGGAELRDDDASAGILDLFVERGGRALDLGNVYAAATTSRSGRWSQRRGRGAWR